MIRVIFSVAVNDTQSGRGYHVGFPIEAHSESKCTREFVIQLVEYLKKNPHIEYIDHRKAEVRKL